MKKIFSIILVVLAFAAVSCEKLLDIPQKGTVSTLEFYASDDDAQAALNDMYADFVSNVAGTQGIDNPEQVIINYSADDILAAGGDPDDHADFRVFCEFRYDDANGVLKECYNRYVGNIYHCNLVISNFTNENADGTEPKWESDFTKQCVAEARVLRAYVHLQLAILWNTPGIIDRLLNPDELPTQAESQSQVLEWVIAECEKAIASGKLPKRNGAADKNATARMSVGFAQFVAGKAAVFNNDMATARKYLGDLINSGSYSLVPTEEYWTNFHVAGDGNAEKIFEPNYIYDETISAWGQMFRSRWMVADVFNWRTDALASTPAQNPCAGWNGGAIQEDFAKKFLEHDGRSARRLACFLTEEEWLYEMDWSGSQLNDALLLQKKRDPNRGISSQSGVYSHGPYFEWKFMVYHNPPKILTGGKSYPADNIASMGANSNQTNFNLARYAEALLLYAEACIGTTDESKGLKALREVQERSGSGKLSVALTIEDVMEEKQYEMWFESCRFHDLVRWGKKGFVDLNKVFNTSGIHEHVPTVSDAYFLVDESGAPAYPKYYQKEHHLVTTYSSAVFNAFTIGRNEYFPFPRDVKAANPYLEDVLGWSDYGD